MSVGGVSAISNSVQTALQVAGAKMDSAAGIAARGDLDSLADASLEMTQAKVSVGVAANLMRTQDEMFKSTLDMLV